MRDYLVFVRAGSRSLHPEWLAGDPRRNWDCCVNAWDTSVPEPEGAAVEWRETGGLNKFVAFHDIYPRVLARRRYRRVLLLDDDLRFAPGALSRFFALCERSGLNIAQPAIALGSHANHVVNIRNPLCDVRRVNFVELMAPCFDAATLESLLPTFTLTRSTMGIDWAWSSLLGDRARMGIVDAVPMQHTKPMDPSGGPYYQRLRSMGIDPVAELHSVYAGYPAWGPMRTLVEGHAYRWPLPSAVNRVLVAAFERRKLALHRRSGGTLVAQTPPPSGASRGAGRPGHDDTPRAAARAEPVPQVSDWGGAAAE